VLQLLHVLYGVQPRATRALPFLPPEWQDVTFSEAVTDSREVEPEMLFVALSGERTDGHIYLRDVISRGARGALVARDRVAGLPEALATSERAWAIIDPATGNGLTTAQPDACLLIAVDDPLMALQRLAVYHRRQLTPTVVGITGSVGKTSTKEVTAAVLRQQFRTLKNKRSFNSEVTLPTSLLRLTADHEVAVLEMGMWAPGEIRFLAQLAQPKVGIVTNVGPSHLERLGSIEAIAHAKAELPESLPATGWCILNADDPLVAAMAQQTQAQVLTYGTGPHADLWADQVQSYGFAGISFRAHYAGASVDLRLPLIGRHSVYLALAAAACGLVLGMGWDAIIAGLNDPEAQPRLRVVRGLGDVTLIDDSYNAAPVSVRAALDLLSTLEGRRVAVLGDMLELGAVEQQAHRDVGNAAAAVVDQLVTVGERARWIAAAAQDAGMPATAITAVATQEQALDALRERLQPGATVLVKGSRGMALERLVAALQQPEEER
jgi:UDP-N-acetylmuramoyl-tripeptide--D-alanyl-D-alanine ligase